MSDLPRLLTEHIREDGTVEGCMVETYFLPLEYVTVTPGEGGYLSVVGDGGAINYEMRLPLDRLRSMILAMEDAAHGALVEALREIASITVGSFGDGPGRPNAASYQTPPEFAAYAQKLARRALASLTDEEPTDG
jgi:hypothetical protein